MNVLDPIRECLARIHERMRDHAALALASKEAGHDEMSAAQLAGLDAYSTDFADLTYAIERAEGQTPQTRSRLSPEARNARRPLPPDVLANGIDEVAHEPSRRVRAARTVKVRPADCGHDSKVLFVDGRALCARCGKRRPGMEPGPEDPKTPSPEDTEKVHALSSARYTALAETIAQAERDGLGRVRFRHVTYAVSSLPPMVEEFDLVRHESGQWFRVETGSES